MKSTISTISLGFAGILLTGLNASAISITETGDAGQTIATAQETSGGALTGIDGVLHTGTYDADIYCFRILADGTLFSATTYPGTLPQALGGSLDTMLMLFDASGHGIIGNDDIAHTPFWNNDSSISATLDAGEYYLAISGYNYAAFDSLNGAIFPGMDGEGLYPGVNGALDHFDQLNDYGASAGSYHIDLVGATACVPDSGATISLLGMSLTGLAYVRRKRA